MIKVGAATEIEMKEKKARVEDALHATRAAVEEGVVPGGGVALIRAQKALDKLEGANEDQTVGIAILRRSIEEPLRQIVENAGEDAAVILNKVKDGKGSYGYNAATGEFGDLIEAGILDPTKVTRLALQNAASVAGLLLTTEVMIAEAPKDEAEHGHGAPAGRHGRDGHVTHERRSATCHASTARSTQRAGRRLPALLFGAQNLRSAGGVALSRRVHCPTAWIRELTVETAGYPS